jgi:hypothetical protein
MKISVAFSTFLLLMTESFLYDCSCQITEPIKANDSITVDTVFYEYDPKINDLFIECEEMPKFPGGEKAIIDYVSKNTIYPQSAINDSISGFVILHFIIDIDGSTNSFRFYKNMRADIDNECIRVIKEMPKWTPGKMMAKTKKGIYWKTVPVHYWIKFNFALTDVENKNGIVIRPK